MSPIGKPGMSESIFLDTYAIFEIIKGNPNYKIYEKFQLMTTIFNLAKFNYNFKKEKEKKIVDEYTKKLLDFVVDAELEDIQNAMDLKSTNRNLSIPDAVGYTVAKRLGVKFLTGDKDFKDMENVEFVLK